MKRLFATAMMGAALVGVVAPATNASAVVTDDQSFLIYGRDDGPATVVATGPVSGVGIDDESDTGEAAEFVFGGGHISVLHPPETDDFRLNEHTCVAVDRFTGTYSLVGGTGAYAGIRGAGTYRGKSILAFSRRPEGSCAVDDLPVMSFFLVRAVGTTTLP